MTKSIFGRFAPLLIFVFVLTGFAPVSDAQTAAPTAWTPELQIKVKALGAPRVSPDSKRVALASAGLLQEPCGRQGAPHHVLAVVVGVAVNDDHLVDLRKRWKNELEVTSLVPCRDHNGDRGSGRTMK